MWAALRAHPDLGAPATARFALIRAQLERTLVELGRTGSLTSAGRLWADRLTERIGQLAAVPVPASADAAARREVAEAERTRLPTITTG